MGREPPIEHAPAATLSHVAIESILAAQSGVITRAQALACGVSDDSIRHRVGCGGRWQRVLRGIYVASSSPLSEQQLATAALLYAGPEAQLAGTTACRRLGLRYLPADDGMVRLLVPHAIRRMTSGFVAVTRTASLPTPWQRGGLPCSPPPRAVLDGCLELRRLADVRALLAESVQRGLTRLDRLEEAFGNVPRRGCALVRRALDDIRAGCRSAPECGLRSSLGTSRVLPEPRWNVPVYDTNGNLLGIPDAWLAAARLALEVNSVEHHFYGDAWEETQRRITTFGAGGILLLPITPRRIRSEPSAVRQDVEQAYSQRLTA